MVKTSVMNSCDEPVIVMILMIMMVISHGRCAVSRMSRNEEGGKVVGSVLENTETGRAKVFLIHEL